MGFLVENKLADDAVRRNAGAGYHYFDKDTLRWFGSKVHEGYDLGDGATLVLMSNKDRGMDLGGQRCAVVRGRRHYYFVVVSADGDTDKKAMPDEFRYDVSKETGYWMSLATARRQVNKIREALQTPA